MQRYILKQVLQWVETCTRLRCVPLEYYGKFKALVDQANSADESQRRYERAMGSILAGAVVDIAEADE